MATQRIVVHYPNLPLGGGAFHVDGEIAAEYRRMSLFLNDLELAKEWVTLASKANTRNRREAFLIAALIWLCRCFESTAGLRQKPLKLNKVFVPADRAIFKHLHHIRNKFIAHDVQTHPMQSVVLLLDDSGEAIDAMVVMGDVGVQNFQSGLDVSRLIETALRYVREHHLRIAERLKADWNGQPIADRQRYVPGKNKIEIQVKLEAQNGQSEAGDDFTVEQEYWISGHPMLDYGPEGGKDQEGPTGK